MATASSLPFIVTIVVVSCAAIVNFLSSLNVIRAQNRVADKAKQAEHENKISEFRHKWIQNLRKQGAEICQQISKMQFLSRKMEIADKNLSDATRFNDEIKAKEFFESRSKLVAEFESIFDNYLLSLYKLKLSFKEDDNSTKSLFDSLNHISNVIKNNEPPTYSELNDLAEIVSVELQRILKKEWEVTKSRRWNKATDEINSNTESKLKQCEKLVLSE